MALPRIDAFLQALTAAGVPYTGYNAGNPPAANNVTVQYPPEATAEQIAAGDALRDGFDWRPRRDLTRANIVAGITALTAAQQNALLRHLLAFLLRVHGAEAQDILTASNLPLAVDEIDPNV